jgi:hypothetical protein
MTPDVQDSIAMVLDILEAQGASLGRPYVDTIKGSAFTNMKELRVQHDGNPYRILFAFDPKRQAVLLTTLGGALARSVAIKEEISGGMR